MSERSFEPMGDLTDAFAAARKDAEFRQRVYEIKEALVPESPDAQRTPIHFESEHWSNGSFVVLQMQKDVPGRKSDENGGEYWRVTDRTRGVLSDMGVPFNEGRPARENGNVSVTAQRV